ncbi:hypothetical protein ABZ924_17130 [Streptomyces sp. NPDC046876]|uniref:hypothetical protein n=1 Tax=Streptomyces sp. NPDC046876 TaxID=3155616 RepID=UPI0033EF8ED4
MRESIDLPEDRGCLQWVLGVPLGLLYLLEGWLCYGALVIQPTGGVNDRGATNISAACFFALCLSVIGLLITLIPTVRRTLGLWWFAPPVLLGLFAYVRVSLLE